MSIETWKREFYPVEACNFIDHHSDVGAIKHCVRKWEGLSQENLEKHKIKVPTSSNYLQDAEGDTFYVDCSSCALCRRYQDECQTHTGANFQNCPLLSYLGSPCDAGNDSPYKAWFSRCDNSIMLNALKQTLEAVSKESADPQFCGLFPNPDTIQN